MTLEVASLTVEMDGTVIVDGVDLRVAPSERLAVMGPSGAGKSTLLRAIAGVSPRRGGSVVLDGTDLTDAPPHRRRIGLMFQDYALFPHLDVAGNVGYGLRIGGVPDVDRRERVDELLAMVGLTDHAQRRIDGLSGGEQQRVALARTLAPRPDLVLFDEPLGSLDQGLKDDLIAEMRAIVEDLRIAAVYVTHDRFEAEAFADRIAIMREGRIVRLGPPRELWVDPRTEFVARFMGHTNVVDGASLGRDGRVLVLDHAISDDPPGPIEGTVVGSVFRDGRHRVTVEVRGERLTWWTDRARDPDTIVRIAIDESGVVPLRD